MTHIQIQNKYGLKIFYLHEETKQILQPIQKGQRMDT